MNFFSKLISALVCFVVLAALSAPMALAEKPVVGMVMKSLANEFFKVMEEGARKFAKEDGSFELIAVGMNSETDIDTQVAAMENFISQKVDMIVVAPADSVGMVASVKKAVEAGIVVVIFDVTLNKRALTAAGRQDVLIVGFDNVPAVQKLVRQGRVLSTIDQFGPEMAANAIRIGFRILKGEKLKGWVKTTVEIVKRGRF